MPTIIAALCNTGVVAIDAGDDHSAALSADGKLWTWGLGSYGALGHDTIESQHSPQPVKALFNSPIVSVAAGGNHTVALSVKGRVYTWGCNTFGQLGVGNCIDASLPCVIEDSGTMQVIRVCAITAELLFAVEHASVASLPHPILYSAHMYVSWSGVTLHCNHHLSCFVFCVMNMLCVSETTQHSTLFSRPLLCVTASQSRNIFSEGLLSTLRCGLALVCLPWRALVSTTAASLASVLGLRRCQTALVICRFQRVATIQCY